MPTWFLPVGSLAFALVGLIVIGALLIVEVAVPDQLWGIELIAVGSLFGASGQAKSQP